MSKSNKTGIYKYEPLWGEWYVDSLIGKGSFGEVYRIYKTVKGRRVEAAAKYISVPKDNDDKKTIYSSGLATDDKSFREVCDERAESMTDEINLMLGLQGLDNIVSYEDHIKCPKENEIGWDIIIRMELLTSLDKYLENNDFYLSDVLRLGVDLCNAINSCHHNGITHRDVKIENIFVDKDGHFKLGDFGVSRMSSGKTTKGTITGTEEYMAPEMLKKEKYNNTVDIYSLGLVLYRLLNNKRMPFLPSDGRITISDVEVAANKRLEGNEFPSPHYADEELCRIINKACAYDKHERYQSATEMAEELEKVILSQDVLVLRKSVIDVPPVPPVPPVSPVKQKKKTRKVLILSVLLFLVLGLLLGGWFLKTQTTIVVTDITGFPETLSIVSGDSLQLKANVLPAKAEQVVVYSSSDETIVSVDETGKIIANSAGKAVITASAGAYFEQIEVSVVGEAIPVEDIVVQKNVTMPVNATVRINTKIIPENATYTGISYRSSNNDVVSVDESGNATAKSVGEAEVFVKVGEVSKTIPVKVEKMPVTDLNGLISNIELEVGKTHKLDFTVVPEDATNTTVSFESSDNGIVAVDENGNIVANKVGSVTITVTCDDIVKTVTVIVKENTVTVNPTEDQPLPHVHSYGAVQYKNEHPHEGYKECSCGAIASANNNQKKSNCSQCYPCEYCNSTAHLTNNHPACSYCGSKNHTTYEHDESDGWVTYKPSNASKYDIETRTEYLYETRQTCESGKEYLSGWDLYDEDWEWGEYGSWSSWQDGYVSETDSRQVRTREVVDVPAHTEYSYVAYVGNNNRGNRPCSYCATGETNRTPEEVRTSWSETRVSTPSGWNYKCPYGCSHKGGQYFSNANAPGGRGAGYFWHDYVVDGYSDVFFWEESRYVDATYTAQYQYQERDKVYTYYFEKWTEDSNWTTTKKSVNDNRKLVDQRTVYKWVLK